MIAIREEIRAIEQGSADREDNLLKNAPHTLAQVIADDWPAIPARAGGLSGTRFASTRSGPRSAGSTVRSEIGI